MVSYILYQVIQQFVIQPEQQKRYTRLVDIAQLLCAQHASYHLLQLTLLVRPAKSGIPKKINISFSEHFSLFESAACFEFLSQMQEAVKEVL